MGGGEGRVHIYHIVQYTYTIIHTCRYPMTPPTVRFLTKILHPNVSRHGDVGIDIFQHNWSLALNISKVLLSLQSLLTDPYTKVTVYSSIISISIIIIIIIIVIMMCL